MRSRSVAVLGLVVVCAGLFFGGCKRQVAQPTFPPTATFTVTNTLSAVPATSTFTSTATWTSTPVFSSTFTSTRTATLSPTATFSATSTYSPTVTATPTITPTPTSTNTVGGPTDTWTATPTPTGTSTHTATLTVTSTPTHTSAATQTPTLTDTPTLTATVGCPLPVASSYTFDSTIGCWQTTNLLTNTTVNWAAGPAGSPSGGGAFHATVAYSAVSQLTEEFEVPLPANTDLTNKIISMRIYIDNSVKGTAWGGGIQTYIKNGASSTFCNKSWVNISGFGAWYRYTMDLSTVCTAASDVRAIGLQIIIANGGSTGNIYIDDVTITDQPTATPTATITATPGGPTSTPTATFACPLAVQSAYNFDSNIGCWITNNVLTTTVANWANGPGGSTSGGGAFHATVAYSAVSQLTEEFELPLPAGTDLTGKTISMNMYIDTSVKGTAWGGGIQTYIKYGASTTFCNKSWVNISGFGDWYPYSMNLATDCTVGATDVRAVGVQVIVANGGGSGNLYIDDVAIQ